MYPCDICGHPCRTVQGKRGHEQLAHPGEVPHVGSSDTPSGQETQIAALNDPELPALRPHSAEREQRFIQTLDRLDQAPQAIDRLIERIGQVEASLGEDGELMGQLANIDLAVCGLLDHMEESGQVEGDEEGEEAGGVEAEGEEDEAAVADPAPISTDAQPENGLLDQLIEADKRLWNGLDDDVRKGNPLLFPPDEEK